MNKHLTEIAFILDCTRDMAPGTATIGDAFNAARKCRKFAAAQGRQRPPVG